MLELDDALILNVVIGNNYAKLPTIGVSNQGSENSENILFGVSLPIREKL